VRLAAGSRSSSARSVVRQLITPPSQISHTPSRRREHRTDAQSGRASLWQLSSQNFHQYIHIDRSLTPLLVRPSLALVRKAFDRMWFRRHWYWPSGYIVVGIIVALLTNNIHLSSLSGFLLSILAVLLWPFILGAALCRLLGFHIPGIDIT
jgi:hypothetical protein